MDLVAELNNKGTKRNKFQVFKNASFNSGAIPVISGLLILLWHEIQGCLYDSEVRLFGHFNFRRKPLLER